MASKPRSRAGMDAEAVARLMAAQDQGEQETPAQAPTPSPTPAAPLPNPAPAAPPHSPVTHQEDSPPAFDPGKVDGRTLRKTGREPFATRIKPETHEALRRIAYTRRITIAEAVELAVAAYERT